MKSRLLFAAAALLLPLAAHAEVTAANVWARPAVAGQTATGVFMKLQTTDPVTLIGGSTPAAQSVEVHEMKMDGDVMKMRRLDKGLPLSPDKATELAPGGLHIMLIGLEKPLAVGDKIPLTLQFESVEGDPQTLETTAEVRSLTGHEGDHGHMAHGAQHH